jgi:hypothetical protein
MATLRFDNPFHDLWVTEILEPGAFVRMFSDVLVQDAEALFSTGNIVLKGRQGSGKSMLLNLLETSTRVAYVTTGTPYPVPEKQRCFLSAGVQLTQQSAALVAARAAEIPVERRAQTVAANFADYLNALLSRDLLRNIEYLARNQTLDPATIREVPVNLGAAADAKLISFLSTTETWHGIVGSTVSDFESLSAHLDWRLKQHRLYANDTLKELPQELLSTRSSAGLPVAELAEGLRSAGILPKDTLILLRVDQHEELFELERHSKLGTVFRQVLNSALARRDPRVAYRVGTRHYAWETELASWGSGAPLEWERDYSVIDLDAILRRGEQSKGWKFPELAKDVLRRRLQFAGFGAPINPIAALFGKTPTPRDRARKYAGSAASVIQMESGWSQEWIDYLNHLWSSGEQLDAKFGEAWLKQESQKRGNVGASAQVSELPWRKNEWWVKERNEIALLQLAGDRQQALSWGGEKQIVDLAGTNILAFMTICKSVWATWQRRNARAAERQGVLPEFSVDDQLIGITEASQTWFKKIRVGLEADRRTRLVSALGSWFRKRMLDDRRLAYPGHNGFSLPESSLSSDSELMALIKICRDHGDLLEAVHTTRNRNQERRLKWYLHPLLSPLFRIPSVRTKEPIYTTLQELATIVKQPKTINPNENDSVNAADSSQLALPGMQ